MNIVTTLLIKSSSIGLYRAKRLLVSSSIIGIMSLAMTTGVYAADIEAIYDDSCAACHNSGALKAIKKGDSAKWQKLIQQKGMPTLIDSVKNGMTQMPAGGLCETCSDEDYRQLIKHMAK
ncbi:c-type cytochrome [Psychrobacter sp. DM4]|uniref:c-type cytochrome n=1 Tax=Psychrobacter sp. DM4 TaxID=3440637 RepID=UPI003F50A63F